LLDQAITSYPTFDINTKSHTRYLMFHGKYLNLLREGLLAKPAVLFLLTVDQVVWNHRIQRKGGRAELIYKIGVRLGLAHKDLILV